MIRVGLTGSIAMGKSTVAEMFAALGAAVHDSDAAVARLYGPGGKGAAAISELVPEAVSESGVDKTVLRAKALNEPDLLRRIEELIHPLVRAERAAFARQAANSGAEIIVYDVPLLFETGADGEMDVNVVVSAPAPVQRARALARPGMTEDALAKILARQMPDADKRARADAIIDTSVSLDATQRRVVQLFAEITSQNRNSKDQNT